MRRVLWKEWREKRMWPLLFMVFAVVPVLCHEALSFGGKFSTTSFWTLILLLPGLLLGMMTFSRETGYECQDFLLSRPIGWQKILLAKILVDAGIMLSGVVVGAIVFRLLVPGFYHPFAGIGAVLVGIGIAFGAAFLGYLPGFASSAVLPGFWGSGMVLCLICLVMGIEAVFLLNTDPGGATLVPMWVAVMIGPVSWVGLVASWLIGGIISSAVMAKRGLGLSAKDRAKRFAILIVVISTIALPVTIPMGNRMTSSGVRENVWSNVSAKGSYVFTAGYEMWAQGYCASLRMTNGGKITRLADGTSAPLESVLRDSNLRNMVGVWIDDRSLLLYPQASGASLPFVRVWMEPSGKLKSISFPKKLMGGGVDVSPDGRYALVVDIRDIRHRVRYLVNTDAMKIIQPIEGPVSWHGPYDGEVCEARGHVLRIRTSSTSGREMFYTDYQVTQKGLKFLAKTRR